MTWNFDFARVPKESWTALPLEDLAMKYDTVEEHGWYDNLIPTVQTILDTHEFRYGPPQIAALLQSI